MTRSLLSIMAAAVVAVPVIFAGPAYAQDSPEELQSQIDDAWRELEPIIEEHNAIRIELEERQEEAEELEEKIEPLQLQVDLARAEISDIALYNFKGGNVTAFKALLTTGSPLTFAEQLTALDQFARAQQGKILKVLETKEAYETEQEELDALVAELTATEEDLAERADEIDAEIDRLEDLREEALANAAPDTSAPAVSGSGNCPSGANAVMAFACAQLGKPYGWGTAGPDTFDCSGLTMRAWEQAGASLPHNAAAQRNATRQVDRTDLQPGDLVFYHSGLSHVGLYAGNGWIVHAPQAGNPVRMMQIDQMPIHSYGRP
ncbi:C40 family peptidase [Natronosporangium hydrolyticum]|uniref:C40 family peptidase n=1 Tax=Natronosporangium hydrolyticum TaxID=2811111 RepID=A0A895YF38_9ACTN|nr:NlpC/P60 family protein [Natronosporangium hydrolyticum]QSB14752.1 C40 family peptidase [Natronosporangium hydrolyticum]